MTTPFLPDGAASALYLELLAKGRPFRQDEVRAEAAAAFDLLRSAQLVVRQQYGPLWNVVSPRIAAVRVSEQLWDAGRALLDAADAARSGFADLTRAYDESEPGARGLSGGVVESVDDGDLIQERLEQLVRECTWEALVAQPGGARLLDLERSKATARDLHRRGVVSRVLYQHGARADPTTSEYAAYAATRGTRVRSLDEDFDRMFIFDRRVAVIAGPRRAPGERPPAVFIDAPALVAFLVDQFDRDWARAERVRWEEPPSSELGELLAQGLTHRGIAKRLGLSERTVAAQIARLREEYDADTLFQLGWLMRGVS
ncbi:LuxR family transcriptional regulator [Kitasatospora sp. NPDC006697]|uniref:LuxR family transcriptional regulator n=1 Tax=Kitasatospora sp. NPDC006697 TaxID=3364020 RepID=UPI0036C0E146